MHVDLVTRHAIRNYGSLLQTIATRELLSSVGLRTRVVDYRQPGYGDSGWAYANRGSARNSSLPLRVAYAAWRDIGTRRIGRTFEAALREQVVLTAETYRSISDLRESTEFSAENYYCVGSDQVWNAEYNIDNTPYYLDFAPSGSLKFSLSSSIGAARLDSAEEARLVEALSTFSGVSVREAEAAEYLRSLGLDAKQHVDPTLGIDPRFWHDFAGSRHQEGDYLLVYQLNGAERFDKALRAVAQATGLPIRRIEYWRGPRSYKSKSVILPSLEEFVALFRDAKFVVTDSFHGTVFSTTFGTRFAAVPPPKYAGRIKSLLSITAESDRLVEDPRAAADLARADDPVEPSERSLASERGAITDYLANVTLKGKPTDSATDSRRRNSPDRGGN